MNATNIFSHRLMIFLYTALSPLSQKRGKSIVGAILREKVFENVPLNSTVIYRNSDSFYDCFEQNNSKFWFLLMIIACRSFLQ